MVAALGGLISDLDKKIEDATGLLGELPLKALKAKLTALSKQRDAAAAELDAVNLKVMTAASAPVAFDSIKEVLKGFAKVGDRYAGSKQEATMVKAIQQLRQQLDDNETRKKLLALLPRLVEHLDIDIQKKCYRIVNHAGEVSEWRQLVR